MMVDNEKKRGKLSMGERATIEELVDAQWKVEEIARHLNRTPEPIKRYIAEHFLTHQGMSNHDQDRVDALKKLQTKTLYQQAKKCFSPEELATYEEHTVDLYVQFKGDTLASEEYTIHYLTEIYIKILRNSKKKYEHTVQVNALQQTLDEKLSNIKKAYFSDVEEESRAMSEIERITSELEYAKNAEHIFENEYNKLVDLYQKLQKELKADRATRIKHVENSKSSFISYLRMLEDEKIREREGKEAELHRLAKEKARVKYGEYHEYMDGSVDRPFLNDRTVMLDNE